MMSGLKTELRSLADAAEQEFKVAIDCMNDKVVPEVRRQAKQALSVSSAGLRKAADMLDERRQGAAKAERTWTKS